MLLTSRTADKCLHVEDISTVHELGRLLPYSQEGTKFEFILCEVNLALGYSQRLVDKAMVFLRGGGGLHLPVFTRSDLSLGEKKCRLYRTILHN